MEIEEFLKQTERKLQSYENIDELINNHMCQPEIQGNSSMKLIHAKQKIWRIRAMALNRRDNSKKRVYKRTIEPLTAKQKRFDSSDEEEQENRLQPIEFDDGKRDKIFSKTFLRSISNQSKVQVALIQMMGEDRVLRSELQSKLKKPEKNKQKRDTSISANSPKKQEMLEDDEAQIVQDQKPMSSLAQKFGLNLLSNKVSQYEISKKQSLSPKKMNEDITAAMRTKSELKVIDSNRMNTGKSRNTIAVVQRPQTSLAQKTSSGLLQRYTHQIQSLQSLNNLLESTKKKEAAVPGFMRPTTCFANQSKFKKKVVIEENLYREPSLKLLNALREDNQPQNQNIPDFYEIKKNKPKVIPANYQEIMRRQAQEDCKKPPLPFLSKSLANLETFYQNPSDEKLKEKVAYMLQKSTYHEYEPLSRKVGKQVEKKISLLNEKLARRKEQTNLDIQELRTEFTRSITEAWDHNVPTKVPLYQNV